MKRLRHVAVLLLVFMLTACGSESTGALAPRTPASVSNCDPHYPDVCIPRYPPDLNCGDIPFKNFRVLQPDPHGFDRDKDGWGCEG